MSCDLKNYISINRFYIEILIKAGIRMTIPKFLRKVRKEEFNVKNRAKLNELLSKIKGKNIKSNAILDLYRLVNEECDKSHIDMRDDEYNFFLSVFKIEDGENQRTLSVEKLAKEETVIFQNNAKHFPEGTVDYEVRTHRGGELPNLLAVKLGEIEIVRDEEDKHSTSSVHLTSTGAPLATLVSSGHSTNTEGPSTSNERPNSSEEIFSLLTCALYAHIDPSINAEEFIKFIDEKMTEIDEKNYEFKNKNRSELFKKYLSLSPEDPKSALVLLYYICLSYEYDKENVDIQTNEHQFVQLISNSSANDITIQINALIQDQSHNPISSIPEVGVEIIKGLGGVIKFKKLENIATASTSKTDLADIESLLSKDSKDEIILYSLGVKNTPDIKEIIEELILITHDVYMLDIKEKEIIVSTNSTQAISLLKDRITLYLVEKLKQGLQQECFLRLHRVSGPNAVPAFEAAIKPSLKSLVSSNINTSQQVKIAKFSSNNFIPSITNGFSNPSFKIGTIAIPLSKLRSSILSLKRIIK